MKTSDTPIGCGDEGAVSKHSDVLNALEDMAGSYAYAVRKGVLREAARLIMKLERELAAVTEERDQLAAELLGVKEYREKNPLGGPARRFDAVADAIRGGMDYHAAMAEFGLAERAEYERLRERLASSGPDPLSQALNEGDGVYRP